MSEVLSVLWLSVRVASAATLLASIPAIGIGYGLARHEFPGKRLVSAWVGLPLVLPPTAVGYLLLRSLAESGPLGPITRHLDILLTWKGAVVAGGVMAFPLIARTARVAFEGVDPQLESMARTLGWGRWAVWRRVTLPLAARGLTAGTLLGFTRAIGEFGATVTVAGNIPGHTRTLAGAIWSAQQQGDDALATNLLWIALAFGLAAIWVAEALAPRPASGRASASAES